MECCNGNIQDLGCIYSCDLVAVGQSASATGVYTLEIQPDGIQVVSNTITLGNSIVFDAGYLNEDGVTVFKVIKPDGTYLSVSGADCFQVSIKPTTSATVSNVVCPPGECVVTVTDPADSSVNTLGNGESYTCIKKLIVYVYFTDGTDTITANGIPGTITTEATDGASTFTYNGSAFAAWGKAWGGDVTIVRSSSSGAETLTLTGTYT